MSGLKKVIVPGGTYQTYAGAYRSVLPSGVRMVEKNSDGYIITDNVLIAYTGADNDIEIPDGVEEIAEGAFQNNTEIERVKLPKTLSKIGSYAFSGCTGLKTIEFGGNEAAIEDHAFNNCSALTGEIKFSENLTEIKSYAFAGCSKLEGDLRIPGSVTTVSEYAFNNCASLNGIMELGNGITTIEKNAFAGCSKLTGDLVIPDSVTEIGRSAFYNCSGFDGNIKLSDNLKTLDKDVFYNCSQLSGELVIPDSVTGINYCTFYNCKNITSVVIGENVGNMGTTSYYAEGYSEADRISWSPFYGCSKVETIEFKESTPPGGYPVGDRFNAMSGLKKIIVPAESYEAYQSAYGTYIPTGVVLTSDSLTVAVGNFQASKVYSTTVLLTWNASKSQQVIGYHLYRDGALVGDTTQLQYLDTDLQTDKEYQYSICGYTEDGKTTPKRSIAVTPKKPVVTAISTDNKLNKVSTSNTTIYASVNDTGNLQALSEDNNTLGTFYYFDDKKQRIKIGIGSLSYSGNGTAKYSIEWDISDLEDGNYTVEFEMTDADGESDNLTTTVTIDRTKPQAIATFVGIGDTNSIVLNWSRAAELDVTRYRIYRRAYGDDGYRILKYINNASTLTYTDTSVKTGQKYSYYIVAVNDFYIESEPSDIVTVMPEIDSEAPRVTQMTPVNGKIIGGMVSLSVQAQDNVSVTKTELYMSVDNGENWTLLASAKNSLCTYSLDTSDFDEKKILIKGMAYDAVGNESTGLIYEYKIDNIGPEKVTGLEYESTATTVILKWNDVSDQDFSYFRLERKNADGTYSKVTDITRTLGVNLSDLTPNTSYVYRVVAYDQLGNRGEESDDITVVTAEDTTVPVITSIKPDAGYYNNSIPLIIEAKDDASISKVLIQTSVNSISWEDYKTFSCDGKNKSVTIKDSFDLSSYNDGVIYIRAIATDGNGNKSDESNDAPYIQYIIDKKSPKAPNNLKLAVDMGSIEVTWDMGTEDDLADYTLYRSTNGVDYTVLKSGLYTLNYYDRDVEKEQKYWYKLKVKDYAGNISEYSEAVQGMIPNDTEAPEIKSISPENGTIVGPTVREITAVVSDNWKVSSASITYTVNDNKTVYTVASVENVNNYYKNISGSLELSKLRDGDQVHLKVSVTDAQGLTTEKEEHTYIVDKTAPEIKSIAAVAANDNITINWEGNQESDLAGYRVYRRNQNGKYTMIAQRAAVKGNTYQYIDYNAVAKENYYYKVEAIDKTGNTKYKEIENEVYLLVKPDVKAVLDCDLNMQTNTEYAFSASASNADRGILTYKFDFGDGTIEEKNNATCVHKYNKSGNYKVTLTVTDNFGLADTVQKTVAVNEPQLLGTIKAKIVDVNGKAIAGVPVYFDLDNTSENVKYTNTSGEVAFVAKAARYSIGAYVDGYLPVKKSVVVKNAIEETVTLTMVKEPIVTGEFEVSRMTLDEIIAAGIDVNKPANQQVVKVTVHLTYGKTSSTMNIITNGSKIYSGGTTIMDTDEGKRKITANVISVNPSTGTTGGLLSANSNDVIVALLDVPIEASYLKEFFDVKLHIVNHADTEFSLTNNEVKLNVPDGMSLVEAKGSNSSNIVDFDKLGGQQEKTITWTLRGDEAGEYDLSADYNAVLEQFNAPVSAKFKTDTAITVYGKKAMKLIVDANRQINDDAFYFDISMENISDADMYMPSLNIADDFVTSYQNKNIEDSKDDPDYNVKKIDVRYLNAYVKNANGYKKYIGTAETLSVLETGSRYTKKYAAYNATEYDNISYIKETATEIENEYGIEVEVNYCNSDLYSVENADDKVKDIITKQDRRSIADNIIDMDNEYFYYYVQALADDDNFMKKLGESFYISSDAVLNLDFSGIKWENTKEITRNYFYQLIQDDAFGDAVEVKIDDKYIKMTKTVLSTIGAEFGDIADKNGLDTFNAMISQSENISKLAASWKLGGPDNFISRLISMSVASGISVTTMSTLNNIYKQDQLNGRGIYSAFGDAVQTSCSEINSALGDATNLINAFNNSAELTQKYVTIAAAHEEALVLCDLLLSQEGVINNKVIEEVKDIKKGLLDGFKSQAEIFANEVIKNAIGGMVSKEISSILKTMDSVYNVGNGIGATTVYSTFKTVFNTVDYLFQLNERVTEQEKLRVAASLTYALRYESHKEELQLIADNYGGTSDGNSVLFLKSLKYLIRMRLIGEKIYTDIAKDWVIKDNKVLQSINNRNYTGKSTFKSLEEYYKALRDAMLYDRDTLYNTSYSNLDVPDAPIVTIDYVNSCTNEVFSNKYEYSFDGVTWKKCENSPIKITPKTVGQKLWVRASETSSNKAGNICKTAILGKKNIEDDIEVALSETECCVTGLSGGEYYYLMTDDYNDASKITSYKTISSNGMDSIHIPITQEYKYLKIIRKASNYGEGSIYGFDSNVRTVEVNNDISRKVLNSDNVQISQAVYTYNGVSIPQPKILYNGSIELEATKDCYISYKEYKGGVYSEIKNTEIINPGVYVCIITGINEYIGTVSKILKINKGKQNLCIINKTDKITLDMEGFQLDVDGHLDSKDIIWKSSDESVASVDQNGYVKIYKESDEIEISASAIGDDYYESAITAIKLKIQGRYEEKNNPVESYKPDYDSNATAQPEKTVTPLPSDTAVPSSTKNPISNDDKIMITSTPTVTQKPDKIETSVPMGTEVPKETQNPLPCNTEVPKETQSPLPYNTEVPKETTSPKPTIKNVQVGDIIKHKRSNAICKITNISDKVGTAAYVGALDKNQRKIEIPAYIKIGEKKYNITTIASKSFSNCKKIKSIKFGKNIITIGKKAFYNCTALTNVNFNNKLLVINDNAFCNCKKIKKITITKNVIVIGKKAFYKCKALKDITVKSDKLKKGRVGYKSFGNIYKCPRIKISKKRKKVYVKIFILKGMTRKAKFVTDK